jgi:zinc transport system ATP-binding protein
MPLAWGELADLFLQGNNWIIMSDSPTSRVLVSLHDISLSMGNRTILDNISLEVQADSVLSVIGPNGAGKSTLLRILLGLQQADSGEIFRQDKLRIGYVPQKVVIDAQIPLTVRHFVQLSGKKDPSQLDAVLIEVGAHQVIDNPVQSLSGGEFQRVLLARALLREPQLLVLDEPASGMDVIGQQALYETIRTIRDKHDCGVLMVSHDLHLVMAATGRVICLNTHVCCTGHPDDVSEHPEYIKLFGNAIDGLALYAHHHDHEHDLQGNIVDSEHSHGCEHHQEGK